MHDGSRILPGLGIFLLLATYPVWHAVLGRQAVAAPKLEKATEGRECVLETGQMRRTHMQLLVAWRDQAVRESRRLQVAASGRRYDRNLTGTCLRCHADRAGFCDRCHNYVQADPDCWECHVDPKGGR